MAKFPTLHTPMPDSRMVVTVKLSPLFKLRFLVGMMMFKTSLWVGAKVMGCELQVKTIKEEDDALQD